MVNSYLKSRLDEARQKIIALIDEFCERMREEVNEIFDLLESLPLEEGITERQKRYIRLLCQKLKRPIPEDLDLMSKREASQLIDQLLGEINDSEGEKDRG